MLPSVRTASQVVHVAEPTCPYNVLSLTGPCIKVGRQVIKVSKKALIELRKALGLPGKASFRMELVPLRKKVAKKAIKSRKVK